jgi:hypothetical protein
MDVLEKGLDAIERVVKKYVPLQICVSLSNSQKLHQDLRPEVQLMIMFEMAAGYCEV